MSGSDGWPTAANNCRKHHDFPVSATARRLRDCV